MSGDRGAGAEAFSSWDWLLPAHNEGDQGQPVVCHRHEKSHYYRIEHTGPHRGGHTPTGGKHGEKVIYLDKEGSNTTPARRARTCPRGASTERTASPEPVALIVTSA
ncbi:hypothetical protein ACFY0F_29580 [Streptomyces sp. NPDC001544]|uniref:hypothetical protein n=1 Tax=Streptomyces sp. NPDC001544 TaxID=3364584 RepID=UPI003675C4D4